MRYLALSVVILALFATAAPAATLAQNQPAVAVSIAVDLDPASTSGIRPEGLVSDATGRLYTSDLDSRRLFRFTPSSGTLETLGTLPRTATGMAFDVGGDLYLASGDAVLRIASSALQGTQISASQVVTFATGVAGANGLAFDGAGRLYVSGGATGNIYMVASTGVTSTLVSGLTSAREDQKISTNGLAFWTDGTLYSSNTGTGSIDRITISSDAKSAQVQQWVKDPLLLGADGITFASNGDLYVAANERNAIVRVTPQGQVSEVASNGNSGPLQFPASPAFSGNALYASNFDVERGANAPSAPGVGASIARLDVGVTGLPLPVAASSTQPTPGASATVPSGTTPVATAATTAAATSTAVATIAPTTALPVATEEIPASTPGVLPTVEAPGMPRTGSGADFGLLLAVLAASSLVLTLGGLAAHRRSTYNK
ncbi:MAG TPA: SMP-30/gluconolactonase/LRE family protein [Chloroflexia bacterium]|nr:SMP-30/gluconolactonase/LRE family protein [Chloroflexia bacterium]